MRPADGKVINHPATIFITILTLKEPSPSDKPTPVMAPISTAVVDIGKPMSVAIKTATAPPNCAQNPDEYDNFVIFSPTVAITLYPYIARPKTRATPPIGVTNQSDDSDADSVSIPSNTSVSGPIAFATSLPPWAKDTQHAVRTIGTINHFSASSVLSLSSRLLGVFSSSLFGVSGLFRLPSTLSSISSNELAGMGVAAA